MIKPIYYQRKLTKTKNQRIGAESEKHSAKIHYNHGFFMCNPFRGNSGRDLVIEYLKKFALWHAKNGKAVDET